MTQRLSSLETYYKTEFEKILRQRKACTSMAAAVERTGYDWMDHAQALAATRAQAANSRFTPVLDKYARNFIGLVSQTDRLLQDVTATCGSRFRSNPLAQALEAFRDQEGFRLTLLTEFTERVAQLRAFHGPAHAQALAAYIDPRVNAAVLLILTTAGLDDPYLKAEASDFVKESLRELKVDLEPLQAYKQKGDPTLALWDATLQEYRNAHGKEKSKALRNATFADDLNALKYWSRTGLKLLNANTGKASNGEMRPYDFRALDRLMELYTMGLPPTAEAAESISRQMGDIKKVQKLARYHPRGGSAVASIQNYTGAPGNIGAFDTPMLAKVRTKLVADPALAEQFIESRNDRVPLAVHRTDFDFVRALRNSPELTERQRQAMARELKLYEQGQGPGQDGVKTLPRISRQQIAALRKQYSLGDEFTSSGRLLPLTPKEAASVWNRFMFRT